MHLVFVEERTEGRLPELAEVRDAVRRDWTNARRLESNEKFFQSLLKHYQVVVEKIDPAKADKNSQTRNETDPFNRRSAELSRGRAAPRPLFLWPVQFCSRLLRAVVSAHEVRPAYLELRQTATDTYDVLWKVPARGDNMRLGIYVEFPSGTTKVTPPRTIFANDASTERWSIKRPGGLTGGEIQY